MRGTITAVFTVISIGFTSGCASGGGGSATGRSTATPESPALINAVLTSARDGTYRFLEDGNTKHVTGAGNLRFSRDGSLITCQTGSWVRFIDSSDGSYDQPDLGEASGPALVDGTVLPDQTRIVVRLSLNGFEKWVDGTRREIPAATVPDLGNHWLSEDGRWFAAEAKGTVYVWELVQGGKRLDLQMKHSPRYIRGLEISPDSRWLAAAGADATIDGKDGGVIEVWSLPGGEVKHVITVPEGHLFKLSFDRTSKLLAAGGQGKMTGARSASGRGNGRAWVWSVETGKRECEVGLPSGSVASVAVSSAIDVFAIGTWEDAGGRIQLWTLDGKPISHVPHLGAVRALALDPKGSVGAAATPDGLMIFDASAPKKR